MKIKSSRTGGALIGAVDTADLINKHWTVAGGYGNFGAVLNHRATGVWGSNHEVGILDVARPASPDPIFRLNY